MRKALHPRWILYYNTLPTVAVLLLFLSQYQIIESLLDTESKLHWLIYGGVLIGLALLNIAYLVWQQARNKLISSAYALINLFAYILFLYLYAQDVRDLLPREIPRWLLVHENLLLYMQTFLTPTLAMMLLALVLHSLPEESKRKPWLNFALAAAIPFAWWLFMSTGMRLFDIYDHQFFEHLLAATFIISTLVFLFFLLRCVYGIRRIRWKDNSSVRIFLIALVVLILPIAGLLFNIYLIEMNLEFDSNKGGVFGNFHYPWVYALTVINGILLLIPAIKAAHWRLALFFGRAVTYSFSLYFLLVMLPFLPVSIIAIIAIGAGFLMMAPVILSVFHTRILVDDFRFLRAYYSPKILNTALIIGLLTIPAFVSWHYWTDRQSLHSTLDYMYQSDYSTTPDIHVGKLAHTIKQVRRNKHRNDILFSRQTPYLSAFYKWIVLDNMSLSNAKIETIERIFIAPEPELENKPRQIPRERETLSKNVLLTDLVTESHYDSDKQQWESWLHIELTNQGVNRFGEYITHFDLPPGTFISDYYLYVGDEKKYGILAEERAATWVYNQIRDENRDPGILVYQDANTIEFKVFPFAKKEVRRTGIQLIHRGPVKMRIDGETVQLGDSTQLAKSYSSAAFAYISTADKLKLPVVDLYPYVHFVIDVSTHGRKTRIAQGAETKSDYAQAIEQFLQGHPQLKEGAKVSFANIGIQRSLDIKAKWKQELKNYKPEGGFFAERVLQHVAFEHYTALDNSYPIVILVTDRDLLDWERSMASTALYEQAFPTGLSLHHLDGTGYLESSLMHISSSRNYDFKGIVLENFSITRKAYAWPTAEQPKAYLSMNDKAALRVWKKLPKDFKIEPKSWESAIHMQAEWTWQQLYPSTVEAGWLPLLQRSFNSRVMMPSSSYIVVENEAQEKMLARKQSQAMEGKASLDLNEGPRGMDEPPLWLLGLLLLLFYAWHNRRQFKSYSLR